MRSGEKELPLINWKAARKFIFYPFLTMLGCIVLYYWLGDAFPAFMSRQGRLGDIRPLRTEAAELALTYDKVLDNPAAAIGKPVLWCVQNRGEGAVTVGGAEGRMLKVLNYPEMPRVMGSKHSACADMLLSITEVSGAGETRLPVTVRFVELLGSDL